MAALNDAVWPDGLVWCGMVAAALPFKDSLRKALGVLLPQQSHPCHPSPWVSLTYVQ